MTVLNYDSKSSKAPEKTIKAMLLNILIELGDALAVMPRWEKGFHIFWLLGPAILLIERSPADIWLSVLAIAFVVRSILKRDGGWLEVFWVRACFLFVLTCIVSAACSEIPIYSLSELLAWVRFPLFAMATAFWLGTDKRLLYGMLVSTGLGMFLMTGILTAELIIEGQKSGRLLWPYGDEVPGNYLSKVGLPVFTVMVGLAIGAKPRLASTMGSLSLVSILISVFTGERINFLLRACCGMLAALAWRPSWKRFLILITIELFALLAVFISSESTQMRLAAFISELPTGPHSGYYRTVAAGPVAAQGSPFIGIGPATFRELCPKLITNSTDVRCDNHPHNFYVQLFTEVGFIGLISGSLMLFSIVWATSGGWRYNRDNVVSATAFVIPVGLFFPLQTTGDFFGQWNNIFMWSAVALALAAARTLTAEQKK